jgi:hypothetical protein
MPETLSHGYFAIAVLIAGIWVGGCGGNSSSSTDESSSAHSSTEESSSATSSAGESSSVIGSTKEANEASSSAIGKAEFVAKANAICVKGEREQEAKFDAYAKAHQLEGQRPTQAEEVEMVKAIFIPNVKGQIDALTALGAPRGEVQHVSAALAIARRTLDRVEADPAILFGNEDLFATAAKQLHALGLVRCAPNS